MSFDLTLDQVKELEQRGAELARQCKWSGIDILAITAYALTDANFHAEAAKVNDIIDILAIAAYALTDANFHAEAAKVNDILDALEHAE